MKLRIGILGCRGIPNRYGGFEQLAQYVSKGLVNSGHMVSVYCSHNHPYKSSSWNGVELIHKYDPERTIGTIGQFIYDFNCIRDARNQNYDVVLFLGYTSSSIWGRLFPYKSVIISHMDGLEWKRTKYSKLTRKFLQKAEGLAIKYSDYFIADSSVIKEYLNNKFNVDSEFISYGGEIKNEEDQSVLSEYNLTKGEYFVLMARIEPENNIEMILEGYVRSSYSTPFIIIGDTKNKYAKYISNKYKKDTIIFAGGIYDTIKTHTLKHHCSLYFHGHSVGGTNPSLLEAMADKALIASHDNEFNRAVLGEDAYYFKSAEDVSFIIKGSAIHTRNVSIENNYNKVLKKYNWDKITDQYENFITQCYTKCN